MATYKVRKNSINNFKYIVFKHDEKHYKAQKLNTTDVYLWFDTTGLGTYVKLIKVIKSYCNSDDFDALYKIVMNYLNVTSNATFSVSIEFVIDALQSRYDDVAGLWGCEASQQLWEQVLDTVEACGLDGNVTSPSYFVDNYLVNGEFVSKDDAHWWLSCDSSSLSQDEISEKWLEYCENNACLYNDDYACLSF